MRERDITGYAKLLIGNKAKSEVPRDDHEQLCSDVLTLFLNKEATEEDLIKCFPPRKYLTAVERRRFGFEY